MIKINIIIIQRDNCFDFVHGIGKYVLVPTKMYYNPTHTIYNSLHLSLLSEKRTPTYICIDKSSSHKCWGSMFNIFSLEQYTPTNI